MNRENQKWTIKAAGAQLPGVRRCPEGIQFTLEIQEGQKAELVLVSVKTGEETVLSLDHIKPFGNVLTFCVEHLEVDAYTYYYRLDGTKYLDIYARSLQNRRKRTFGTWDDNVGKKQSGTERGEEPLTLSCGFFNPDFDWQEDACPKLPLRDVILYCTHLRGFTKHVSSKVKERGTFLGMMEKIPYLKELGINQIELMPVCEFRETIAEEEMLHAQYRREKQTNCTNYWGYSAETYYFAVKQTYAAGEDAASEFKTLVRELHKNGIELILEFYFEKDCPVSFVCQCLAYWALEYHVDGFHITGSWNKAEELLKEPILADKKIYSASFGEESCKMPVQPETIRHTKTDKRRAAVCTADYQIHMRSFLKSDSGKVMDAAYYMRRNHGKTGYVNYFASHDGFTMMDMVSYDHKHNEENEEGNQDGWEYNYSWNCGEEGKTKKKKILELRRRQMKNAWVMLLFSQGIPAILAGDERCNSQNGNNNVYCQDNETGWINWKSLKVYEELYTFVRKLIQLRKEHPVLHMSDEPVMTDYLEKGYPDLSYHSDQVWYLDPYRTGHSLGMLYCGEYAEKGEDSCDDYFYIANNMGWNKQKFAVPDIPKNRTWHLLIDTGSDESITEDSPALGRREIEVPARSIVVLIGKSDRRDKGKRIYGGKSKKKPGQTVL